MKMKVPNKCLLLWTLTFLSWGLAQPARAASPGYRKVTRRVMVPASWSGRCVAVSDGDSISVMLGAGSARVRLYGIDCPESGQSFAAQARQYTSWLALGKMVTVYSKGTNANGQVLGWVFAGPRCINRDLVTNGLAWHYRRVAPNEIRLAQIQTRARQAKRGLWSDWRVVPPWEWHDAQVKRAQVKPDPGRKRPIRIEFRTRPAQKRPAPQPVVQQPPLQNPPLQKPVVQKPMGEKRVTQSLPLRTAAVEKPLRKPPVGPQPTAPATGRDGLTVVSGIFIGRCVSVPEGDIITVRVNNHPVRVRLYGIDCPDSRQALGAKAKQFTSAMALGKPVTVEGKGLDHEGRVLGWVFVGTRCVNADLVASGHALHYRQGAPHESKLAALEAQARKAKRGLWADR